MDGPLFPLIHPVSDPLVGLSNESILRSSVGKNPRINPGTMDPLLRPIFTISPSILDSANVYGSIIISRILCRRVLEGMVRLRDSPGSRRTSIFTPGNLIDGSIITNKIPPIRPNRRTITIPLLSLGNIFR